MKDSSYATRVLAWHTGPVKSRDLMRWGGLVADTLDGRTFCALIRKLELTPGPTGDRIIEKGLEFLWAQIQNRRRVANLDIQTRLVLVAELSKVTASAEALSTYLPPAGAGAKLQSDLVRAAWEKAQRQSLRLVEWDRLARLALLEIDASMTAFENVQRYWKAVLATRFQGKKA